jgi:hypothetical protein
VSITRDKLKVGEKYIGALKQSCEVLYIGTTYVIYRLDNGCESTWEIKSFIEGYSLIPKPKKQIKLVGVYVR